jgi:hypothetical protein
MIGGSLGLEINHDGETVARTLYRRDRLSLPRRSKSKKCLYPFAATTPLRSAEPIENGAIETGEP